jgi:CRISPR-associated exonuclease Cas4
MSGLAGGSPVVLIVLVVAGLVGLAWSARAIRSVRHDRRRGSLSAVDRGTGTAGPLRSVTVGLLGRPDEVRRARDGRPVPLEHKSRPAPARGPPASHRLQVEAYCLLLEETTGRSPPYGVLRYADGTEWEVPWTADGRRRVLATLASIRGRYDGRATPGRAKCAACAFRRGCDARA